MAQNEKNIKWTITVIILIISIGYSAAMTVAIGPMKKQIEDNKKAIERQYEILNNLDKRLAVNSNNFKHIQKELSEIKSILKEMNGEK